MYECIIANTICTCCKIFTMCGGLFVDQPHGSSFNSIELNGGRVSSSRALS